MRGERDYCPPTGLAFSLSPDAQPDMAVAVGKVRPNLVELRKGPALKNSVALECFICLHL